MVTQAQAVKRAKSANKSNKTPRAFTMTPASVINDIVLNFLLAKQRNPMLKTRPYYDSVLQGKVSFGSDNFYKMVGKHSNIISTQSPYGILLDQLNQRYIYSCCHYVHEKLTKNSEPDDICPQCTSNHMTREKRDLADKNLADRLSHYNKQINVSWPPPEEYQVEELWDNVQAGWEATDQPLDSWFQCISQMQKFRTYLDTDISVRCLELTSVKMYPDTREINGATCPRDFDKETSWNPRQVLKNPGDGSIGLAMFGKRSHDPEVGNFRNRDYAGIGTVQISNEVITDISRSETKVMQESIKSSRSGAASGFLLPGEKTKSMSKCTEQDKLLTTNPKGTGTAMTMTYVNHEVNQSKKLNSVYSDLYMSRLTKAGKRKAALQDPNLRKKLIAEMKSRLTFLMIVVLYDLDSSNTLFQTFAEAVMRVHDALEEKGVRSVKKSVQAWREADGKLSSFELVLLEYACGTGEMRNHQPVCAHIDRNRSHPVESMMVFGKVAENETRPSTDLVRTMTNAKLIQPFEQIVWDLRCGYDVLHSNFMKTYHVSDLSRGDLNWSYVHGP